MATAVQPKIDAFARLYRYKVRRSIPTWEQVVEKLIKAAEDEEVEEPLSDEANGGEVVH